MASLENKLPPELLLDIFSRLRTKDVKSTRLVCKRFNQLASYYLLERVYFALRPKTEEVFQKVTTHPVFSKTIKEVVFDASYYDQRWTSGIRYKLAYPVMAKHPVKNHNSPSSPNYSSLYNSGLYKNLAPRYHFPGYYEYRYLYCAQERMKRDDHYMHVLRKGLQKLPKIDRVIFSDWRTIARWTDRVGSAWGEKSIIGPSSWYLEEGPMRWDIKRAPWPIDIRDAMEGKDVYLDPDHSVLPLYNLLRAVLRAGINVRKIGGLSGEQYDMDISPQPLPLFVGNWRLLKKIGPKLNSLELAFYTQNWDHVPCNLLHRIEGLMRVAPNLIDVTLRFRGGIRFKPAVDVSDNVMGSAQSSRAGHWPKLRTFRLLGFDGNVHCSELEAILSQHKHTLKHLGFESIKMVGSHWDHLGTQMSAILSLESARLTYLYDEPQGFALFRDHSTGRCLDLEQVFLGSRKTI